MKYPKLFDDQPAITPTKLLKSFADRGLLTTSGQVVGYNYLSNKFRVGLITQADARILLAIEAVRPGGPRETHVSRLLANVYVEDKVKILDKVNSWANK